MDDADVRTQLAVISAKLDTIIVRDSDHEARVRILEARPDLSHRVRDVEQRIGKVERKLAYYTGAGACAGALLGAWLPTILHH